MPANDLAPRQSQYWEIHDSIGRPRFYEIRLEADGRDRWRVIRRWGYLGCRGWRLVHRHEDRAAAEREFVVVGLRRARQGYEDARSEGELPSEGKQLIIFYPPSPITDGSGGPSE
jgi:predicted DNA-binding WGR domain protein